MKVYENKKTLDSFACPDRIRGKISTKLKNDCKISTGTEILQKCRKCYLLCSENPYLSIDVAETFSKRGSHKSKK